MCNNSFKTDIEKDFREIAVTYLKTLNNGGDNSLIKRCRKVLRGKYGINSDSELRKKFKYGIYAKKEERHSMNPNNSGYEDLFSLLYLGDSSQQSAY